MAPSGRSASSPPMDASRFATEGHEVTIVGEIQKEGSVRRDDDGIDMLLMRGLVKVVEKECILFYLTQRLRGCRTALAFKKDDFRASEKNDVQPTLLPRNGEFQENLPIVGRGIRRG